MIVANVQLYDLSIWMIKQFDIMLKILLVFIIKIMVDVYSISCYCRPTASIVLFNFHHDL